ncbi:hypothetical protein GOB93_03220 [Acetobacter musti]|uniref:Toprim domain-containing protein n=1 Tax=Acetobacter musti TaxID=864732 RepID=A0ABX0JLX0_9PROT|nr:toprim domain-containing protein [Acetobacter musti]NHN83650.1 hypothetical protein [Acetobacter musti]
MTVKLSASEVSVMLAQSMETLARELLPGGKKSGAEWAAGSLAGEPGTRVSVHLYGPKAGVWKNFAGDESGDALDLVAACVTAGDTKAAYKWACNWLGLTNEKVEERRVEIRQKAEEAKQQSDELARKRRGRAREQWLAAQENILDTPVDFYLRGRGIDLRRLDHPPHALRFGAEHYCAETGTSLPAMLAAITNLDGRIVALHQTWLGQHGGQWSKAKLELPKKVLGPFAGSCIRLRRGETGQPLKKVSPAETVAIGEGIETCLSVALACPELRILAAISLGNLGTVRLPDSARKVLILADRDEHPAARNGLRKAIDTHLAAGREVRLAMPPKGKDFNDAIQ